MTEIDPKEMTREELEEELRHATSHLVAATSAYETYAGNSGRRSVRDAFFNTRLKDFKKACDRATAAARKTIK